MEATPAYSEVVAAYAQAAGARATWLVRARDAAEVIAKAGMLGVHDRLVAFSEAPSPRHAELFRWQTVTVVDELTPEAFIQGSAGVDAVAQERARLVPEGSPASYAHPAGMSSDRLFWLLPSVGGAQLRVADLRAFARAAQEHGALLMVDNTEPTVFGCHPLALGAHVCLEELAPMADAPLAEPVLAVSVARSLGRRGRRKLADPRAEDAFRLLTFAFGAPDAAMPACVPTGESLGIVARSLDTLAARMQPRFDGAHAVAAYLACHPAVGSVRYPALATHPDHALAPTVLEHGFGPVVALSLTGTDREPMLVRHSHAAQAFQRAYAAQTAGKGAGSPAFPATRAVPTADAKTSMLRLYMGTEDPLAIVDSLDQALRLFCNPPEP